MFNLLSFELKKVFRGKAVYICAGIMCGLSLLTMYAYSMMAALSQDMEGMASLYANMTANDYLLTVLPECAFGTILAVIIPIMICTDLNNGAARVILGRGNSRNSLFVAKLVSVILVTLFLSVICLLAGFLGMKAFSLGGGLTKACIPNILEQIFAYIAIAIIMLAIAKLVKRMAAAIAIGIVGPMVISIILTVINNLVDKPDFNAGKYLFSTIPSAFGDMAIAGSDMVALNICIVIYIAVFGLLAFICTRKLDV